MSPQDFPKLMVRLVMLSGLIGISVGLAIGFITGDELGWALLKASMLGVLFAFLTRKLLLLCLKNWIQARLDHLIREHETRRTRKA